MTQRPFRIMILVSSMTGINMFGGELLAQSQSSSGGAASVSPTAPVRSEQHVELFKLEQRSQELAAQLRAKPDATKEAELKKLVEELFDKRHAFQVAEAKALAERLTKLQDTLKKREQKKSEIIDRRVKQLLGGVDDLDWSVPAPRSISAPTRTERKE